MKQVRSFRDTDAAQWDEYVRLSPTGNCYHLAGWKKVIEESFGHKTYYRLCENEDGRITGIVPIVHLKSWLFGSFMVSLPYFNYGESVQRTRNHTSCCSRRLRIWQGERGLSILSFVNSSSFRMGLREKNQRSRWCFHSWVSCGFMEFLRVKIA